MMSAEDAINVEELFSIKGKVALVTGGSRGIGLMIARGFIEAGARVYISSRKKDVCDETARRLAEFGQCFSIPADLSTVAGCHFVADQLEAREEALHILVNNAGAAWGAPLAEYPESGWDKVFDTNVKGIFFLTQRLIPMLERAARPGDPGRVINIGSIDGIKVPRVENYAYSPSKAAVHHLTKVLAVKLGRRNITVNAVAPGPFESQMMRQTLEERRAEIEASCPLQRIGSPPDMAGIAIYLSSRAGAYLNGTIIPVDGGISIN
jgi:NAD(P)-dependent dehydrogenase (short-subunit alcohol dehydrogenase family)